MCNRYSVYSNCILILSDCVMNGGNSCMRLNQFEFLIALEEYSSFSKAAQVLFISQPSLSAAIKELET